MADPLDRLERLAVKARQEHSENAVEAAPRVLLRLSRAQMLHEKPLTLFTLGSCAAALAVLVLGVNLLNTISDQLWVLFWMIPGFYY